MVKEYFGFDESFEFSDGIRNTEEDDKPKENLKKEKAKWELDKEFDEQHDREELDLIMRVRNSQKRADELLNSLKIMQ